jgi:hypothetical protein
MMAQYQSAGIDQAKVFWLELACLEGSTAKKWAEDQDKEV